MSIARLCVGNRALGLHRLGPSPPQGALALHFLSIPAGRAGCIARPSSIGIFANATPRRSTSSASSPDPQSPPPSPPEPNSEYILNVGDAIRILRDTLPRFFAHGLQHPELYASNVAFSEPYHTRIKIKGKGNYMVLAQIVRYMAICLFDSPRFDIHRIQQIRESDLVDSLSPTLAGRDSSEAPDQADPGQLGEPDSMLVRIRWVFEGIPRHLLWLSAFDYVNTPRTVYEGVFVYGFDREGRIVLHQLQGIHPVPPFISAYRWFSLRTRSSLVTPDLNAFVDIKSKTAPCPLPVRKSTPDDRSPKNPTS
ncbi:uncharacterized protein BJ171DRAFT_489185 [Polychytrium aggregatum]|uniref:uncharacterized protein n=1 Tax=Polychytrium aggregatum TaxID=110093 RepID=UPI0022FE5465|nr:uncharacterized protein BJ171DRAFT_489185 [Polychytrium aggregatum]KAI9208524.1 hypothetical protein BJ171DRAFT_489185 [Polychytrium aggregatum]